MELVNYPSTGQLMDFQRFLRSAYKSQGADELVELADSELYYCVIVAAQKADWVIDGALTQKKLRSLPPHKLESLAAPIWDLYMEAAQPLDDDEKKD